MAASLAAASTDWRATPLTLVDAARGALATLAADADAAAAADAWSWPPIDAVAGDDASGDVAGPQPGWSSSTARAAREAALAEAAVPPFPAAALATGDAAAARAAVASFCDRLAGGGCDNAAPPPPDLTDWRDDLQEAIYTALGRLDGCGVRVVVDATAAARARPRRRHPRLRAPLEPSPTQNGGGRWRRVCPAGWRVPATPCRRGVAAVAGRATAVGDAQARAAAVGDRAAAAAPASAAPPRPLQRGRSSSGIHVARPGGCAGDGGQLWGVAGACGARRRQAECGR